MKILSSFDIVFNVIITGKTLQHKVKSWLKPKYIPLLKHPLIECTTPTFSITQSHYRCLCDVNKRKYHKRGCFGCLWKVIDIKVKKLLLVNDDIDLVDFEYLYDINTPWLIFVTLLWIRETSKLLLFVLKWFIYRHNNILVLKSIITIWSTSTLPFLLYGNIINYIVSVDFLFMYNQC